MMVSLMNISRSVLLCPFAQEKSQDLVELLFMSVLAARGSPAASPHRDSKLCCFEVSKGAGGFGSMTYS